MCVYVYIYIYIHIHLYLYNHAAFHLNVFTRLVFFYTCLCSVYLMQCVLFLESIRMEVICVVLWRPAALDCRVLNPSEAWNWLPRTPPSLKFEPWTSCI